MRKEKKWNREEWMDLIQDMIFPKRCPVCHKPVPYYERKRGICADCIKKLPLIGNNSCFLCGRKLSHREKEFCEECRKTKGMHSYTRGFALCSYDEVMRESIYHFKYGGRQEYGKVYGEMMADCFADFIKRAGVEAVIPVPLHPDRERKRGFNQAAVLAKAFGNRVGIPVLEHFIVRTVNTLPMKSLNGKKRQNNLKKAFKIVQNDVKLNITIIIDDIYTTGSTIDAIAEVLKNAGCSRVYFLALAIGKDI